MGKAEALKLAGDEMGGWVSELLFAGPETWKWTGPLFWVTTTAPWVLHSREHETLAHEWDLDRDRERGRDL